jgi:intracellular septation protein A
MGLARPALSRFLLVAILPIVAFYFAFRWYGVVPGILAGSTISLVALTVQQRRLRRIDPIALIPMLVISINGSVAVIFESIEVYLLAPSVENVIWMAVLAGSVVIRRPLAEIIGNELRLIPERWRGTPEVRRLMSQVTLLWAAGALVKAAVRPVLLYSLSLEVFLVTIVLATQGLNVLMIAATFWWSSRAARRAEGVSSGV